MSARAAFFCTAVLLAGVVGIAHGSDFPPLPDFRSADPTGRYYVVWERVGGPTHYGEWGPTAFTIAERAPGSPAVGSAQTDVANLAGQGGRFYRMLEHPDVVVRPGDVVHGRGLFDRPPRVVLVSSTGLGFVALDVYGPNLPVIAEGRGGHAVVVFSLGGDLLAAKTLRDLFSDEEIRRFRSAGDVISWLRGAWINEDRHELMVVGGNDALRVLNLVSGDVRDGGESDVVRGLDSNDPEAVKQALILAADRKFQAACKPARRILADPEAAADVRLRAAVALVAMGDRRGADLVYRTALGESSRPLDAEAWDRPYQRAVALEYLPEAVGRQALPLLRAALARGNVEGAAAFTALVKLGEGSVGVLAPMVVSGEDRRLRVAAIGILGSIGPPARAAAGELEAALFDDDPLVQIKAALALATIDPARRGILPSLREAVCVDLDQPWAQPIREAAVERLARLGAGGVGVLHDAMRAESGSVRRTITATLARSPEEATDAAEVLVDALDDEDRTVRGWALQGLTAIGDDAVDALVAGLRSESAPVRSGSAFVLAALGPSAQAATAALRSALTDDDPFVRSTAAGALSRVDPEGREGVATLIALLDHPAEEVRAKAAFRLGEFGPRAAAAVGPLVGRLDDRDRVAAAAASALGKIGPEAAAAVPPLIAALGHGDRLLRRGAASSLGRFGPAAEAAVPALVERLGDEDWQVPRLAATALGQIGVSTPAVVSALTAAVQSGPGDSELRLAAIEALGRLRPRPRTAVGVLVGALGDPCPPVARQAVASVAAFGPPAVAPLREALKDPSRDVRVHAAEALGRIGPDAVDAAGALIEALADADPSVGFYSEQPLTEIGPVAMESLIGALTDRRASIRRVAARILGRFEAEAKPAAAPLAAALDDPDPYVRSQAAYTLGRIGPEARSAADALRSASHDESALVRRAAAWALGH